MMALHIVRTAPTCLAYLQKITALGSFTIGVQGQQVRGKTKTTTTKRKPQVIVQLLKDLSHYGERGRIIRLPAVAMRNHFFPKRLATYMTREVMRAAKLSNKDVEFRKRSYVKPKLNQVPVAENYDEEAAASNDEPIVPERVEELLGLPESEEPKHGVEIEQLAPERAFQLLTELVPHSLTFERRPQIDRATNTLPKPAADHIKPAPPQEAGVLVAAEQPPPQEVLSPMEVWRAKLHFAPEAKHTAAAAQAVEQHPPRRAAEREAEADQSVKIFGSVSLRDVARAISETMRLDSEAARISVAPEDIVFLGLPDGTDKVEKLGVFEVEVVATVGRMKVTPVKKRIQVVSQL